MSGAGSGEVFQPLGADDPASVGTYRLAAKLGAGGMGKVYLSYTPAGRPVAIKVIRPEFAEDTEFRRRFKQEVQAAQRVQGLYTAPVIDSDAEGAPPWLATAFVPGPTLSSAIGSHGPLPVPTVLLLVAGIAEALEAVHGAGLVHRDLKPSNVLLASDGPRVIDFGIARAADATALTGSGVTIGTPAFMSPEQAAGREITPATDVFALGQVAAYAALGAPAYGEGPSHAVLYRIVHEEPDLATLPEELRPLVSRCLTKEPAERPSLAEVVRMCQAASQQTELRRPEQWLPGALAAEIPARHVAPGSPTAATTPADAVPPTPPQPVNRPDAALPAQPPTQPPAQPAAQPDQPSHPPTQPSAPPQVQPSAQPQVQPVQPPYVTPPVQQQPVQHPAQQPAQHPAPGAYGYPATQPGNPAAPAPGAYGYPPTQPGSGSPYAPRQQFGAPQHPLPQGQGAGGPQPPRKRRRKAVVLSLAAALIVIAGAVGGAIALGGHGKDGDDKAAASSPPVATSTGPVAGTTTEPATDPTATTPEPTTAGPTPQPEDHQGIQLPAGYHLVFADTDIQPRNDIDDDLSYTCSFDDCTMSAYQTKLVLLDQGEEGSLSGCLDDTRYTENISLARMAPGAQICARTQHGTVALITYKRSSKSSEASTYVVLDVTLWRNAIPDPGTEQ